MGSAVTPEGLTVELEALRAAGLGGVEITPIYGVVGGEPAFVPFLGDAWVGLLSHTLGEAQRLDLGVDMATGTGWPFGGPWVGDDTSARSLSIRTWTLNGSARVADRITCEQQPLRRTVGLPGRTAVEQVREPRPLPLVALMAFSDSGAMLDLTSRVRTDGTLEWEAPAGHWRLYGVFLGWHGKMVERAAPGGEGAVIDHFSRDAIRRYLEPFDRALAKGGASGVRAFFNDSYEVDDAQGQADGTPAILSEFQRRRGYDLRAHLPALAGTGTDVTSVRVRADYRQTIADLLLETFTAEWRAWARRQGALARNQAHGSPGNLLDLYAATDIPETEGTEIPRAVWASSAAHVAGRQLVAAEAATWLGEHFRSTLADVRANVDRYFVAGVNHIVYHGTAYSPAGEPWPGWLFYASVEFNPRNSWWKHFGALNDYVARTQSFLQAGTPAQDVLLYYPFYESLAAANGPRLAHFGNANQPPENTAFEAAAAELRRRGFTYDYISDRQLAATRVSGGRFVTSGGGSYRTLVIPASRFTPLDTLEQVLSFARSGAPVIVYGGLPEDVAGLADLEGRRARFLATRDRLRGLVRAGDDLEGLLTQAGVVREALVDRGLEFARRTLGDDTVYFIHNPGEQDVNGWIPLSTRHRAAVIFDAMSGARGAAAARASSTGALEVRLALPRGESLIVLATTAAPGRPYDLFERAGPPIDVAGPWRVRFVDGGPALPPEQTRQTLGSWTTWGSAALRQFSGTAVYSASFARPSGSAPAWELDLGTVRDSARVRMNGRDLGTLIGPRFRVTIDRAQFAPANTLEIDVSNLMANRIAAMDKAGIRWRIFYNVNFSARFAQNRGPDGLFSAASWEPLDSGLMGPVTLTPLRRVADAPAK